MAAVAWALSHTDYNLPAEAGFVIIKSPWQLPRWDRRLNMYWQNIASRHNTHRYVQTSKRRWNFRDKTVPVFGHCNTHTVAWLSDTSWGRGKPLHSAFPSVYVSSLYGRFTYGTKLVLRSCVLNPFNEMWSWQHGIITRDTIHFGSFKGPSNYSQPIALTLTTKKTY
jgi:hypothetical protein